MELTAAQRDGAKARVLVVADWSVDPREVIAACAAREDAAGYTLTVPAWLHGLEWIGDPTANVPCAQRQLDTLTGLGFAAGLDIETAGVGDPDPTSAIADALHDHPASEILLFAHRRRLRASWPWDLPQRAQRLTGLPVRRIWVPAPPGPRSEHGWTHWRRRAHCDGDAASPALVAGAST